MPRREPAAWAPRGDGPAARRQQDARSEWPVSDPPRGWGRGVHIPGVRWVPASSRHTVQICFYLRIYFSIFIDSLSLEQTLSEVSSRSVLSLAAGCSRTVSRAPAGSRLRVACGLFAAHGQRRRTGRAPSEGQEGAEAWLATGRADLRENSRRSRTPCTPGLSGRRSWAWWQVSAGASEGWSASAPCAGHGCRARRPAPPAPPATWCRREGGWDGGFTSSLVLLVSRLENGHLL